MFMKANPLQKGRKFLLVFALLGFTAFCLLYFTCLITSRCNLNIDSKIAEASICLERDIYQPVLTVPRNVEQVYLCGQIEGTTQRPGRLYVSYNGEVILSEHFEHKPGQFFHVLPISLNLTGRYNVKIVYAKSELANVAFTVIEP